MDSSEHTPVDERLDLPFEPARRDWAEWVYDHRTGLLATVCVYLLLGVGILTARFSLDRPEPVSAFYVDMENFQELIEKKERLEQIVREEQLLQQLERDYEAIRNRASNADGELNADLQDARGTDASQIYDEARALEARLNASREAYERGLQSASNILNNRPADTGGEADAGPASRQSGRVTVSYYLPGRSDRSLPVPSYQCEGGGTVVVNIEVNSNGQVTKAVATGGGDPCLREYAARAARNSRFNADASFGNAQGGTITYEFVAQ